MGLGISGLHHVAIICRDYERSVAFYTDVLGFEVLKKTYRAERDSYKIDLMLQGRYMLELFSFPNSPDRPSWPEALGLRHIAFEVGNLEKAINHLASRSISYEPVRIDNLTGKKFVFFSDPDGLPLELYEK